MCYVGINNHIENAQSTIIRLLGLDFNFHSSEIHFFNDGDAHFICSKGCFPKRSGTCDDLGGEYVPHHAFLWPFRNVVSYQVETFSLSKHVPKTHFAHHTSSLYSKLINLQKIPRSICLQSKVTSFNVGRLIVSHLVQKLTSNYSLT